MSLAFSVPFIVLVVIIAVLPFAGNQSLLPATRLWEKRTEAQKLNATPDANNTEALFSSQPHMQRGEGFFEALFGFREKDYATTRHQLFQKCTFETRPRATQVVTPAAVKERAVFEHPRAGPRHLVSSGWHSTPSVAELRADTAEMVRVFEQQRPGLLAALRRRAESAVSRDGVAKSAMASAGAAASSTTAMKAAAWVKCTHTVGESGALHLRFPNAFFQVASQFNTLEFISPDVTPEDGVTHYVYDRTQGPACALACMAGTAYRNYLLHPSLFHKEKEGVATTAAATTSVGEDWRGQQAPHQLNLLEDFTSYLTHACDALPALDLSHFYTVRNGYFHPRQHMSAFQGRLQAMAACHGDSLADAEDALLSRLRIGLVEDATVTLPLHSTQPESLNALCDGGHSASVSAVRVHEVSQSYNSALSLPPPPPRPDDAWAGMAALSRIILRGTYEATLLAGVQHTLRSLSDQPTGQQHVPGEAAPPFEPNGDTADNMTLPPIFLTKVGGGVFNNDAAWIAAAIESAVSSVAALGVPLDVRLVHYRAVEPYYEKRFPTWPLQRSF